MTLLTLVNVLALAAAPAAPAEGKWMTAAREGKELYATLHTSEGDIVVQLFSKDAPKTVANFVGLATGEKEWTDPRDGKKKTGTPLYNGTIFHRVIDRFMIQGGDPTGTGTGNPGYRFEDEFDNGHTFDVPGLLAMANAGPGTNGSQFFITVSEPKYLNNRHTIFGKVISGYDEVVMKIATTKTVGPGNRPVADQVIKSIDITDKNPKPVKPAKPTKPAKGKK